MFMQVWNSFSEELQTAKQNFIYTNVTEVLFMKKKKRFEFVSILIVEST